MSTTIPELIVPGSLFIPTDRDAFTIVSGGMPNGDPSLQMDGGSGDANYVAYTEAVDGLHYVANRATADVPLTISFWIKPSTVAGAAFGSSGYLPPYQMLGVHGSGFTSGSAGILQGGTVASHMSWGIFAFSESTGANSSAISFVCPYSNATFPAQSTPTVGGVIWFPTPADKWSLVQIVREKHTPERWSGYLNGRHVSTITSSGTVLNPTGSTQQLHLGCFSELANVGARQDVWELGKLSFHQERLNAAQRLAMYESMTNPS